MNKNMQMLDEYGIIHEASINLPKDLWKNLILSLSELEDNECHRAHKFPITNLRKVEGIKEAVYRANIKKYPCWRIHLQYSDNMLKLKQLLSPEQHDNPIEVVKSKRGRYEL